MKNKFKIYNEGFTLLELMVVIIIVSLLAMLAMPRLFSMIETSRSTEAFASLGSVRRSMERCYVQEDESFASCITFGQLDITNPNSSPGSQFVYTIADIGGGTYTITATRNTLNGGDGTSQIMLILAPTGVTKAGSGAFSDIN